MLPLINPSRLSFLSSYFLSPILATAVPLPASSIDGEILAPSLILVATPAHLPPIVVGAVLPHLMVAHGQPEQHIRSTRHVDMAAVEHP